MQLLFSKYLAKATNWTTCWAIDNDSARLGATRRLDWKIVRKFSVVVWTAGTVKRGLKVVVVFSTVAKLASRP